MGSQQNKDNTKIKPVQKDIELEKELKKFDFTKYELEYIKENANFTDEQLKIFNLLTGKNGRQTITYIAFQTNLSESSVKRRIKEIKKKIIRLL